MARKKVVPPPPPPPRKVRDPETGLWHDMPSPPRLPMKRGPKPKYLHGDELLVKFAEYRADVDANPWYEVKSHATKDDVHLVRIPRQRPYTLRGFKMFAEISEAPWQSYKTDPDFAEAVQYITDTVYEQKFEGAVLGFFNTRIIMRDLGMSDRVNHDLSEALRGKTIAEAMGVVLEAVAKGQFSIEDGERFLGMLKHWQQAAGDTPGKDTQTLEAAADAFTARILSIARK